MRQQVLAIAIGIAAGPAGVLAAGWQQLDGEAVREALEGRRLVYDSGAWQSFSATGSTVYNAGSDSRGSWAVRDGRYCSVWPPSDLWACYDVETAGDSVRFIGDGGDITEGTYSK